MRPPDFLLHRDMAAFRKLAIRQTDPSARGIWCLIEKIGGTRNDVLARLHKVAAHRGRPATTSGSSLPSAPELY